MTRPQIIRADTIDLQDQNAPSAQDHTRQPTHPKPLGVGPPSPHQAGALRRAEEGAAEQQQRSPRVSWSDGDLDSENAQRLKQIEEGHDPQQHDDEPRPNENGHEAESNSEDAEMADAEGDDGLDDDMMDKISSSPSIDDGGSSLYSVQPTAVELPPHSPSSQLSPLSDNTARDSSSPFVSTPLHLPLFSRQIEEETSSEASDNHHHRLHGKCPGSVDADCRNDHPTVQTDQDARDEDPSIPSSEELLRYLHHHRGLDRPRNTRDDDLDEDRLDEFLLPIDDPLLDNAFDDATLSSSSEEGSCDDSDSDSSSGDDDDIFFSDDPRYTDLGWGGECLREIEDIDFEFVYALHTFVATVEGQANATKGDTMVLLDDSNSYWWLVRVVKDSTIGYLPAEHIETPTERLARLNKHRNIDLSATMLGDNPEKPKNPLKKAMRRRNAKTVTFGGPTYVEASEAEYSSDEEEPSGESYNLEDGANQEQKAQQEDDDEITTVEPLKPKPQKQAPVSEAPDKAERDANETDGLASVDTIRTSDDSYERQDGTHKTRNGTVRNTESFFKDDSVETRKITLTPNLLRDDSSNSTVRSNDSREVSGPEMAADTIADILQLKTRASLENLDKTISPPDKVKEDKKKKEKKQGMLSGLFKRSKDKRSKPTEDDLDDWLHNEKPSAESPRKGSPSPKVSEDSSLGESRPSTADAQQSQTQPQRTPGKLQKAPPVKAANADTVLTKAGELNDKNQQQPPEPDRPAPSVVSDHSTMRMVDSDMDQPGDKPAPLRLHQQQSTAEQTSRPGSSNDIREGKKSSFSPMNLLKGSGSRSGSRNGSQPGSRSGSRSGSRADSRAEKAERWKTSKKSADIEESRSIAETPELQQRSDESQRLEEETEPAVPTSSSEVERLSESPVEVSPVEATHARLPPLMVDSSSQEEGTSVSPVSPASTPEMVDAPEVLDDGPSGSAAAIVAAQDHAIPSSTATPTWSDASLRTYLEEDNDIRDLLVVVHDKSGVEPVGEGHPLVGGLLKDERRKVAKMTDQLDGLLHDWLARKSSKMATR
ncbi:MAG: hypothetical protein M1817_005743 [Caeruleum heppii]|nr:MAG: hypothetical protein M1817_005743 [Caeruleum heppii]